MLTKIGTLLVACFYDDILAALAINFGTQPNGSGTQDAAKRQSGNAATRWPITVLFSNGSVLEPLESKMVIGHRVVALPRRRFAASCLPEP